MGKSFARTFGQDLMRGEHKVGEAKHPAVPGRKNSGLADSSAYKPTKRANAQPSGGGGGIWKSTNEAMAASRAKLRGLGAIPGEMPDQYSGEGGDLPASSGTSIFDPVLTELSYKWFCPPGGWILDPFAGGSVRGIVASFLKRNYVGIDLRAEQIAANEAQAQQICSEPHPTWITGDSRDLPTLCEGLEADMVFSCPPYADLERYSDDPQDISTLSYNEFLPAYQDIIAKACALLKPNRFAAFVVGDVRGKDGFYYSFPAHTIDAFEAAGLRLYNDAVLITAVGSLPVRVGKQFRSGRKLGRTHQNLLCFVKGDWKIAAAAMEDSK